ncbi:MAG: hypothetical protein A2X25_11055 [Chloroflexi bacterium GWB2_49_20]|nr:MAG: hypothetical protein A2X25_11055 [Chloroflexi bacterium GWB2_49_20]OGN78908.1 MAG: hypothetical protein A2X26_00300 [Chloroflexi bacterium GWC2_49_37]OGN86331.1 MAG: hypothetical protein A2X27_05480 [Chloroflexi bacterium GWD2_49_16]HBG74562.1 hypothetical protein [Anaerolineae bacterium]
MLFASITALLVFIVLLNPPIDPDMWWHLKSGQAMWQQKTILTHDQFSFTRFNHPWVNAFWITDLFLFFCVRIGGFPLLLVAIALIGTTTFLTLFFRSNGPFFIRSFVILLAAISVSPGWTARPQVFSFFLFAILNLWMEKRKQNRKPPLYFLPILFIVWANLHGGFIWGFLLLLSTIAGIVIDLLFNKNFDQSNSLFELKQLTIWAGISLFAVLINPNGLAIWRLPFYTIDISIRIIQEWLSPNFHNLEMQPFLWIVFLFIIGYSLSENKHSFVDLLKSLGFTYMAFIAQRNIPLSVIVLTPIIIDNFTEFYSKLSIKNNNSRGVNPPSSQKVRGAGIINLTLITLLLIAASARVYLQTSKTLIERVYPVKAVQWIRANRPDGNMFNAYNWGGYLLFNLPDYPVFIDGRADLYGEDIIKEWWSVIEGKDKADTILDSYNIEFLLIEPGWPIVDVLQAKNWVVSYQDDVSVILTREK